MTYETCESVWNDKDKCEPTDGQFCLRLLTVLGPFILILILIGCCISRSEKKTRIERANRYNAMCRDNNSFSKYIEGSITIDKYTFSNVNIKRTRQVWENGKVVHEGYYKVSLNYNTDKLIDIDRREGFDKVIVDYIENIVINQEHDLFYRCIDITVSGITNDIEYTYLLRHDNTRQKDPDYTTLFQNYYANGNPYNVRPPPYSDMTAVPNYQTLCEKV